MRNGTRSQCKTRWSYKGHRPICKMKLGYAFCYLYTALCPSTGHLLALILPDMTKQSFCLFCRYFAQQVKATQNQPVLMIADRAGAHQKQVCWKEGFHLEHLPTACPELNPVERFFEELRKELSNQVFETMERVELHLSLALKKYFHNKNKISQLTNYPYLRTQ